MLCAEYNYVDEGKKTGKNSEKPGRDSQRKRDRCSRREKLAHDYEKTTMIRLSFASASLVSRDSGVHIPKQLLDIYPLYLHFQERGHRGLCTVIRIKCCYDNIILIETVNINAIYIYISFLHFHTLIIDAELFYLFFFIQH